MEVAQFRSFLAREERVRQEADVRYNEWATNKLVQSEVDTLRRMDRQQYTRFVKAQRRQRWVGRGSRALGVWCLVQGQGRRSWVGKGRWRKSPYPSRWTLSPTSTMLHGWLGGSTP